MSFQYLALYTGDYLRDTRHLSPLKHGIYLLLLMHCWDQKAPLPLDEQECAGIANCRSADEIDALRYVVGRFFVRMDDGHYNTRMMKEIERSNAVSSARAGAAHERWKARGALQRIMQLQSKSNASAMQVDHPIPIPIPIPIENLKPLSGKPDALPLENANGKAKNDQAREILQYLNRATERNYQPVEANLKMIRARLSEATPEQIKAVIADRWELWHTDPKMAEYLRPATLFNATKFAQYLGEIPE